MYRNIFKIIALTLLFGLGLIGRTVAQSRFSIYVGGGGMYYIGDLSPSPLPNLHFIKLCGNGGINYRFSPHFSLDLNYTKGGITADDKRAKDAFRINRNLHFNSHIDEISLRLVYDILNIQYWRFVPYIFAGVGYFHFNPTADGVALQPLGTEGQYIPGGSYPKPYKLWQVSLPVGIGLRHRFSMHFGWKVQLTWHYTLTNYLDDVSSETYPDSLKLLATPNGKTALHFSNRKIHQDNINVRGNPNNKDSFLDLSVSLIYYFTGKSKDRYEDCKDLYKNIRKEDGLEERPK